jgi:Ser/Thr protein kinase RdoA (MazF antagonist)
MGLEFFQLQPEEQQKSLSIFAHELLTYYGIRNAKVSCINFGFNATFSVETESGVKYALRININSAKTIKNLLAEIEWVRHLNRTSGINTPTPIATLKDEFFVSAVHSESGLTLFAILYSWLEGEEIGDDPTLDQLHAVGKAIALLHQDSSNFVLSSQSELPTFDDFFWSTEDFLFSEKSKLSLADKT